MVTWTWVNEAPGSGYRGHLELRMKGTWTWAGGLQLELGMEVHLDVVKEPVEPGPLHRDDGTLV